MKVLTKIMVLQALMVISTFVNINYATASIKHLFRKCEECTTVEDQIKFIFLYVVPVKLDSPEVKNPQKIAREFAQHIYQAIVQTNRLKLPFSFCEDFMPLKGITGDTVDDCYLNILKYSNHSFSFRSSIEYFIYNYFSLKQEPMYYFWYYIEHVQESVDIDESLLNGVNSPELFCTVKRCDYEIRVDIPNLISNHDLRYSRYGSLVLLNADYNNLQHKNSKDYVDFAYNLIDKESTLKRLMTPSEFCYAFYKNKNKNFKSICVNTIENNEWDILTTKNKKHLCFGSNLNKTKYLKHMFYNLTQSNTTVVTVEGETINFTYEYMKMSSNFVIYSFNNPLKKNLSPINYCTSIL